MCGVPCLYRVCRVSRCRQRVATLNRRLVFDRTPIHFLIKPLVTDSGNFWQAFRQTLG